MHNGIGILSSRHIVFVIGLFAVLTPGLRTPADDLVNDVRPNFVIILCDDLGYGDLRIHGHPHIRTANLDQLAATGMRFTAFYSAAPVCSPSRAGLLTGRSPNRAGIYDWIPPAREPREDARDLVHLRRQELTLPQLLKQAGYATCLAGKWHCNSHFNSDEQPQPGDAGFDHWLATQNNAVPSHHNPTNYVRNGQPTEQLEGFSCQIAVDEVIAWLKEKQQSSSAQPFLICLPFHEPHEPVASPADLVSLYRDVCPDEDQAQYFANVHNVDLAVGRLVTALEQFGLRDNTVIIFSSDNGPETLHRYPSARRSWGTTGIYRGMKLHTHDGGIHVPGIVNWPGRIPAGTVISEPASSLDLLPTLCELGNARVPADHRLDGVSLAPLFRGQPFPDRPQPLLWVYYNAINDSRVAMRHGRWKVLARLNGGNFPRFENLGSEQLQQARQAELTDFEIYDLQSDPGETFNLAGSPLSEKESLIRLIRSEYQALAGASWPWDRELKLK